MSLSTVEESIEQIHKILTSNDAGTVSKYSFLRSEGRNIHGRDPLEQVYAHLKRINTAYSKSNDTDRQQIEEKADKVISDIERQLGNHVKTAAKVQRLEHKLQLKRPKTHTLEDVKKLGEQALQNYQVFCETFEETLNYTLEDFATIKAAYKHWSQPEIHILAK